MGVNGIYGLSGSGLDIESMVKVGMLSKQSEYEKMQQKFTQNEWKKSEYLDVYSTIQTFNASTLSQYKMSSSMDARSATSANDSVVTATANANAVPMTHYVEVESLASSAYLLGTSMERADATATDKSLLSSVLFKNIERNETTGNITVTYANGDTDTIAASVTDTATAFAFSLNDGVNGMLATDNSDVVTASATPAAATGTYKINISTPAEPASLGATINGLKPSTRLSTETIAAALNSLPESVASNVQTAYLNNIIGTSDASKVALAFSIGDETGKKSEIQYTYEEVFALVDGTKTVSDFIADLNKKIGDDVGVTASISSTGELALKNNNVGESGAVTISIDSGMALTALRNFQNGNTTNYAANDGQFDALAAGLVYGLLTTGTSQSHVSGVDGYGVDETTGMLTVSFKGEDAKGSISKLNEDGTVASSSELKFNGDEGTTTDTNFAGITVTAKAATPSGGVEISNTGAQNIRVTYKDLLDGFTLYDLTSKINSQGTNIRATYDSVQDRFSFYNQKTGADNKITFGFGTDQAATNAVNFFEGLGLKRSANGELKNLDSDFQTGTSLTQAGTNSSARIDGLNYSLDSNNVSVNGVSYNLRNVTDSGKVAVTVTQDTASIVKNVESFVEDYNKLINKLYEWYDEKPNSNYKPLTESQKSGMKEDQIEKWEEKAKAGLLYHDQTLSKVISDIRSAVSQTVDGINSKYNNIFAIGISTTGLKGELKLDKDKLNAALAEDSQAVYNVFARLDSGEKQYAYEHKETGAIIWVAEGAAAPDSRYYRAYTGTDGKQVTQTIERSSYNGIAQRLGDVFQASMKSVKSVSGTTASIAEDSELNNLLRELQTKMSNFKRMMDAFETKLYKKYDAMESALALLGSQLNYVTSAFQ